MIDPQGTFDALIAAFLDCKPYPAYIELGGQARAALLRADREGRFDISKEGEPTYFYGIKIKYRPYLVGWRVASEPEGSDLFLPDASPDEYVRYERGEPKRMFVTSADFDEAEQLRYEAATKRRIWP